MWAPASLVSTAKPHISITPTFLSSPGENSNTQQTLPKLCHTMHACMQAIDCTARLWISIVIPTSQPILYARGRPTYTLQL